MTKELENLRLAALHLRQLALQYIFDKEVDMYRIRVTATVKEYNYFIPEAKQLTDEEYITIKKADDFRKPKIKGKWEH